MALRTADHGLAVELDFSIRPELRDQVSAWWVGGWLVDAGGELTAGELAAWLAGRGTHGVLLGHHHEDHSGGAGLLARQGLEVYGSAGTAARLRRPQAVPAYRARHWGQKPRVRVMPPRGLPLSAVPLPGHSPDQLGYLDPASGWLFSGDLLLRRRQSVAMPEEDPWAMMASLRRTLALQPAALATSHRGLIARPHGALAEQLEWLEELAGRIAGLRARGLTVAEIVREVFAGEPPIPGGGGITWREASGGEFSAARWVRAFLRGPGAAARLA